MGKLHTWTRADDGRTKVQAVAWQIGYPPRLDLDKLLDELQHLAFLEWLGGGVKHGDETEEPQKSTRGSCYRSGPLTCRTT